MSKDDARSFDATALFNIVWLPMGQRPGPGMTGFYKPQ